MSAYNAHRSRSKRPGPRTLSRTLLIPFAVVALTMLLVAADLAGSVAVGAFVEPTPTTQPGFDDSFPPVGVPSETEVPPTERVVPTISPDFPTETADPTDVPTGVVRLTPPDVIPIEIPTETVVPTTETVVPTTETVVPTESPTDIVPTEEPRQGSNTITLWKSFCPEGTTRDLTIDDYVLVCGSVAPVEFTLVDGLGFHTQMTDGSGITQWTNVEVGVEGELQIHESVPDGYGEPIVFCGDGDGAMIALPVSGGMAIPMPTTFPFNYRCAWYNIPVGEPDGGEGGDVTLVKYACPAGTSRTDDFYALGETCFEEIAPVDFSITATSGGYAESKTADPGVPQTAVFTDVPFGEIAIEEAVPAGYQWPLVFCSDTPSDGPGAYFPVEPWSESGAFILEHRADAGLALTCLVFNFPDSGDDPPANLTVVKYTCPMNYDLFAPTADPYVDCPTLTDGVSFVLDDGLPGIDLGGATGDSGTGTLTFADVTPGSYTVQEILPAGMGEPFVLKCLGTGPQLQPYPLWSGNDLPITIQPGDDIVCDWFNVPAGDPELGTLTVTKYVCTTETFISDVDCQVFEGGQTFDLLAWDSVQWNVLATATTDAFGRIVWTDLPIGHYMLAEHDGPWCHFTSSALLGNDDSFNINQQGGMHQSADVYNCGADPKVPGDTPTTWPNTGAGAGATDSSMRVASREERRIPAREGGDDASPASGTSPCLPAGDSSAASGDQACPRGAVPVGIRIDAIGVDAPIEMKETVGGVMQQPTGETAVAWYKESPRLGETGNMLFAGHLNWWGIPQAVFFSLGDLRAGDEIVLTDASGATWTYQVSSVQQEDAFAPPSNEVVGPTDFPAVTLMTCGGDWNAEAGLYDKRTVVRAELVGTDPAPN